ncbi:MAG: type I-E CRISPR-associated protein Cse2/CasB [Clostridiales bacterium]|nr:type I-E CRISPR-associated protein Cse2/CasB [Clostridiales bacterium]
MSDEANQIKMFVWRKIKQMGSEQNQSESKALLAKLRRGIGKEPGHIPELWGIMMDGLPDTLMGKGADASFSERAIYTALTLFALHQQGKEGCVSEDGMALGVALNKLVDIDRERESAINRRFIAAATAGGLAEFSHHLRGLIQIMKAKNITLDYPALAYDLYRFQFPGQRDSVRMRWGRDYYRMSSKEKKETNE